MENQREAQSDGHEVIYEMHTSVAISDQILSVWHSLGRSLTFKEGAATESLCSHSYLFFFHHRLHSSLNAI